MAEPRTIRVGISGTSAVESYTLASGLAQYVEAVYVEVDNTAGADAQPLVTLSDQSGVVINKKRQGGTITGGDTGSASWALRVADETTGVIRYVFPNVGAWLAIEATGQGGPFTAGIDLNADTGQIVLRGNGGVAIIPDAGGINLSPGRPGALTAISSTLHVQLNAGETLLVQDQTLAPIFRVDESGALHGKTGQTLTFDL